MTVPRYFVSSRCSPSKVLGIFSNFNSATKFASRHRWIVHFFATDFHSILNPEVRFSHD